MCRMHQNAGYCWKVAVPHVIIECVSCTNMCWFCGCVAVHAKRHGMNRVNERRECKEAWNEQRGLGAINNHASVSAFLVVSLVILGAL